MVTVDTKCASQPDKLPTNESILQVLFTNWAPRHEE